MKHLGSWISITLILAFFLAYLPFELRAQAPTSANTTLTNSSDIRASLTLQATNETDISLVSPAVNSLLNFGPFVFKTSEAYPLTMKTTIENQITNVTQNVEGTDTAYAVVGIELGKALRSLSAANITDKDALTIQISSTCKPMSNVSATCNNLVQIKPA
jgi:hypothetical protein